MFRTIESKADKSTVNKIAEEVKTISARVSAKADLEKVDSLVRRYEYKEKQ